MGADEDAKPRRSADIRTSDFASSPSPHRPAFILSPQCTAPVSATAASPSDAALRDPRLDHPPAFDRSVLSSVNATSIAERRRVHSIHERGQRHQVSARQERTRRAVARTGANARRTLMPSRLQGSRRQRFRDPWTLPPGNISSNHAAARPRLYRLARTTETSSARHHTVICVLADSDSSRTPDLDGDRTDGRRRGQESKG
jgi:hypothetical protein